MNINLIKRPSKDGDKFFYTLEWGRGKGQRVATGVFTYVKPASQVEKNHNKEAHAILETKRSQLVLEGQAIQTGYIPQHRFKNNFLDYYQEFVDANLRKGSRHLQGSLSHFRKFIKTDYLAPISITENLCERFRQYLLDRFNGSTPADYFAPFKKVVKAATKEGYFRINPVEDIAAKPNKNYKRKEFLEADEYLKLLKTPCLNNEVREAFIFCCYTGLRWCDVKPLAFLGLKAQSLHYWINQGKTKVEQTIELNDIARAILERRRAKMDREKKDGRVFMLPSAEAALTILDQWCRSAGIEKHITWHSARLSFSILLQDELVDTATVSLLLGQTTTKYVHNIYKRYRPKDQKEVVSRLPAVDLSTLRF